MKQYDEVREESTGQGDDYTTGSLLDYAYFKISYRLIAVDLSKKNTLRCRSKSNSTNSISKSCCRASVTKKDIILEKSKETV